MKHIFIINPTAGKGNKHIDHIKKIRDIFLKRNEEYEIILTEYPSHATEIAKSYGEKGEPVRLYAFGGDGTINEIISGAYGYDNIEFAAYPAGTGNDFVKIMGDVDWSDIENLIDGEIHAIDLLNVNNRICANITNIGFDAKVAGNVTKFKKWIGGHLAYFASIFYTMIGKLNMSVKVLVDGKIVHTGKTLLCVAANGNVYGGGFKVAPSASVTDGKLDFVVVRGIKKFEIASFVNKYKEGRHDQLKGLLTYFKGTSMTIESDEEMTVCIDGEITKSKKCIISVIPKALKCIYPKSKFSNT